VSLAWHQNKDESMRFALLIHNTAEFDAAIDETEGDAAVRREWRAAHDGLQTELRTTGELVRSNEFGQPTALVVRAAGDNPHEVMTLPGPHSEGDTWLGGYYVVECDTIDRATEIAGRFVEARFAPIEVRQLMYPDD
jgi:hypothetical protein